jgi:RimJ/RimL family protein N-acetyltransferase
MTIDTFPGLSSPRLKIRRFDDADVSAFLAYRNDAEVARFQSWNCCSEEEAREFIEEMKILPCGQPGKGLQLAIEMTETESLIGDCYLEVDSREPRQAEIGFTLSRPYQKQGFATEAIAAVVGYAFHDLDVHRIVGRADTRNIASAALMERLGMRREGHHLQSYWFKGEWTDEYLYAILKDEWMKKNGGAA